MNTILDLPPLPNHFDARAEKLQTLRGKHADMVARYRDLREMSAPTGAMSVMGYIESLNNLEAQIAACRVEINQTVTDLADSLTTI